MLRRLLNNTPAETKPPAIFIVCQHKDLRDRLSFGECGVSYVYVGNNNINGGTFPSHQPHESSSFLILSQVASDRAAMDAKDTPPQPPAGWDRCHAYNERKKRYCRQIPIPLPPDGQQRTFKNQPRYCGNHRHLMDEWLSKHQHPGMKRPVADPETHASTDGKGKRRKRDRGRWVPCPIDPSHNVFESDIAKHVLICPKVKRQKEVEGQDYYSKGINLGGYGDIGSICRECDESSSARSLDEDGAKQLAIATLRVFSHIFLSPGGLKSKLFGHSEKNVRGVVSCEQVRAITEGEIYNALPEVDLSYSEEGTSINIPADTGEQKVSASAKPGRLTKAISEHRIRTGGPRHLHQIASILGHVRQSGLLTTDDKTGSIYGKNPLIIEMGAGRGMTGLVVAGAMAATYGNHVDTPPVVNLSLVERAGTRGKAETKIRRFEDTKQPKDDCLRLDLVNVSRVKCDLAHVNMEVAQGTQSSNSSKTLVIAKHLCGAGTDIALKSLEKLGNSIDGCAMATCCHGLCTWDEYVGRNALLRLFRGDIGRLPSFGEKEFKLLKRWTSASVLQNEHSSSDVAVADDTKEEHYTGGPDEDQEKFYTNILATVKELGLACGGRGLGRAAQRLIDFGRLDYMQSNLFPCNNANKKLFEVDMLHYVPSQITPQNALLLAHQCVDE